MDIMKNDIEKNKTHIDQQLDLYSNNLEFINMVMLRLRNKSDAELICKASAKLQSKYFLQAIDFLKFEEYEYVAKCITIVDLISNITCDAIRLEYKGFSKSDVNQMCEGYLLGIADIKQKLADGNLLTEEGEIYE